MRLVLVMLLVLGAVVVWLPAQAVAWAATCPVYVRYSDVVSVPAGAVGEVQVLCDGSDIATGGGDSTSESAGTPPAMWVSDSFSIVDSTGDETPDGATPHGWRVLTYNGTADALNLQGTVVCACAAAFVPVVMNPCAPVGPPYAAPAPAPALPPLPKLP